MAYTEEELWVEFYEDLFEKNPDAAMEEVTVNDDVQFKTGDPEIDELERRMADGSISDEEIQATLAEWEGLDDEPSKGFSDDYTKQG